MFKKIDETLSGPYNLKHGSNNAANPQTRKGKTARNAREKNIMTTKNDTNYTGNADTDNTNNTKKNAKQITSRIETHSIKGLGKMPIEIFSTELKGETFEHTSKKAVKEWRKEQKALNKKAAIDPAKVISRLDRAVKRATKVLGEELVIDTVNHAVN